MWYTLWGRDRVIGYTELDIHTVTRHLRQGFVEPAEGAESFLRDATGVPRAIAATRRMRGEGEAACTRDGLFLAACRRREALKLQLRDEDGVVVACDFMRVWDLQDPTLDAGDEAEEKAGHAIASSSDDLHAADEAWPRDMEAEIEADFAEWSRDKEDEDTYHSGWPPPPPPDDRWNTMRYYLQISLETSRDDPEV